MIPALFIIFSASLIGVIRTFYFIKTRFVFKNEIEKEEFLTNKYKNLIGINEDVIIRTKRIFGPKERVKESIVKEIIVEHPRKQFQPWRVFKVLEFNSLALERGYFCGRTEIGKTDKYKRIISRSFMGETFLRQVELYSILDTQLEELEDFKSIYPANYVSIHTKNLVGSFNNNDSFTHDMEYISDSKNINDNAVRETKFAIKKTKFCSQCGKEFHKNLKSNFCAYCGNKL